ncbi:pancreatic triacylglycerol lipase-like, partial [Chironomus tepperi]|uniref:pancreatic triacylglycerol lipase-like n=1 Tax=Chironomus tepperi TaxID=113505 RepID=UPI00391F5D04
MKLVLLILVVAIVGAYSAPVQDNSIYGDERWTIARDGEGRMHLVDLNPLEVEPETFFDPSADMFFLLYTRSNPTDGQRITYNVQSLGNFRRNGSTRVLIHGWTTSSMSTENVFTRNEFLAQGDHNVIAVDWSVGASANYITSRNRVSSAGQEVARFLDFLHSKR